jgi:sulfite dehydrogenase
MNAHRIFLSSLTVAALAGAVRLAAVEIKLPPEKARFAESPLPGYALTVAMCGTCHSADYIAYQPTSTRAYWQAAVTKMQKTFGAPIPADAVEPIVDYLVKTYGTERSATPAAPPPKTTTSPAK